MPLCGPDTSALGNYVIVADVGHLPTGSARYVGAMALQADTSQVWRWDGTNWRIVTEPRQAWTPTVAQGAAVSVTVVRAWVQRFADTFHAHASLSCTSAGTSGSGISISTPFTMPNNDDIGGGGVISTAASSHYACSAFPLSTTAFGFVTGGPHSNYLGNDPSIQLTSGAAVRLDIWGAIP